MKAKAAARSAPPGFALVAALGATAALGLIAAAIAAIARSDVLVTRNLAGSMRAYYLAEAGVFFTLAQIPPGSGTPEAPFRETAEVSFPSPPSQFTVSPLAGGPLARELRLIATGSAPDGATRSLEFIVRRSRLPTSPGALIVGGDHARLDVAGVLFVDGRDHSPADRAGAPRGERPPAYAVASPPGAGAEVSLSGDGRVSLQGRGRQPGTGRATPPDLGDLARGLSPASRGVTRIPGPARVGTSTALRGIVLVEGPLSVEAPLKVTGLLAVRGPLTIRSGRTVVRGAVWLTPWPGRRALRVDPGGELRILYSVSALQSADRIARLPRWPVVAAIREHPG